VTVNTQSSFQTILVGDNATPEAERAVGVAMALAQNLSAKVILLGVLTPPSAESQAEGYGVTNSVDARKKLEEHLEQKAQAARQSGIAVITRIAEGMPEASIEKIAEQEGADLIVVGHRHIDRIRTWLEGSTSASLLRRCPVSVLVVPDGDLAP
jgi:nucleotide-binding universal stress UspA family protein